MNRLTLLLGGISYDFPMHMLEKHEAILTPVLTEATLDEFGALLTPADDSRSPGYDKLVYAFRENTSVTTEVLEEFVTQLGR